jgi:S1-C subfamily serine protease
LLLIVAGLAFIVSGWGHHGSVNDPNAAPRAITARGDLAADEKATIELFKEASPSVVYITTLAVARGGGVFSLGAEVPKGTGSGFVWDDSGRVVTNYHVLQDANAAKVTLHDGSSYDARLVGAAADYDLAVLKIDAPASKLHPIQVGQSKTLQVGQKVFAIGDPFGLDYTLTTGVVSALDREIKSVSGQPIGGVIQTDAAINPGNSGGPLLDSAGLLIGVNTAIYSPSGAYAGIGFAIPVDMVNQVVPQLIAKGEARLPRAALGVTFVRPQAARSRLHVTDGLVILDVKTGTAAEEAGLRPTQQNDDGTISVGDILLAIDGQKIHAQDDVQRIIGKHQPGDKVSLTIRRDGKQQDVQATLRQAS